jgi:hypothetical protein
MDSSKKVGAHVRRAPPNVTHQTRISTEPALPCKRQCGNEAASSRKDGLCSNCGTIADTHGVKHE